MRNLALLAALAACAAVSTAHAAEECGRLENGFGPFDYRTATEKQRDTVERYHFTDNVATLRKGESTIRVGGEDMDLMLTAMDIGLGFGRFPELKLEHLMPAGRLTPEYMEGLLTSIHLGMVLIELIRFDKLPPPPRDGLLQKLTDRWRASRLPDPIGRFYLAEIKGRNLGAHIVADWRAGKPIRALQS